MAQLPIENYCLLCREKLKSFSQATSLNSAESVEVYQDIFHLFSKYMKWDPPPEYKYDFHKHQFPFCSVCHIILIRIYRIQEDIQSLEKQIDQFVLSATAKIIDSQYKQVASSTKEGNSYSSDVKLETAIGCGSVALDERKICFYYRESTSKRYSAKVKLTNEDLEELEKFERTVKSKTQDLSGDFDQDDVHEGFVSSPEGSAYSGEDSAEVQSTAANANNNATQASQDSTSDEYKSDEGSSKGLDPENEQEVPRVKKPSFNSRIKELSPNKYLLDDKLIFVYQNPDWKCSSCSETTLEKSTLVSHFKSAHCPGLVSPNSVKELQHRGFKYDELDDGGFECRRCPFATTSKPSLKRHIETSHYRSQDQSKIGFLMRGLVKNASVTQLRPGVFLVNNEHEVRFWNNKFSCSACSFSTGAGANKTDIIRHVIQQHGNQVNRIPHLTILPDGPNKYKLGDFPFEAFPDEFKCTTCGHSCASLLHMKQHIRYEHVKDLFKNVCDICGYSTFDRSRYKRHMSSHKTDRPYLCPTCGKSFKHLQVFRVHQAQVHPTSSLVQSYLCELCGRKFAKNSLLRTHMKFHEKVDCEICGKASNLLYLPRHLFNHSLEK